jgi:hypothetical protein
MSRLAVGYLGEEEIYIGYSLLPAEPDVGLKEPYVDDYWLEKFDGTIDTARMAELTVKDHEYITQRIADHIENA